MSLGQADEDYLRVRPCSARRDVEDIEDAEDPELILDAPNATKRQTMKSRLRAERGEINSVRKTDNAVFKARKRKKLRSSVSKSTVTTKDTGFVGRKETKKRRHRGGKSTLHTIRLCIFILQLCRTIVDRISIV